MDGLNPSKVFSDGSLVIECSWRIHSKEKIIVGSIDFQEKKEEFNSRKKVYDRR